ncbi:MAG: DUF2784 domain-containing protein [Verrucomicrobiae bacterium]|nr:DUF2784 domain-containing protein [Verrucomicrobiae bacterium]
MATKEQLCLLAADAVLMVHFAFVAFVVLGLVLIWIGHFRRWSFVRNFWFRIAHLLAIGIVAGESLLDIVCPLTTWEAQLRLLAGGGQRYEGSFIQHWVHRIMFYEASETTFAVIYVLFFLAVLASLWWVKPRWPFTPLAGPR